MQMNMLTSPGHADVTMNGSEIPRQFEVVDVSVANATGSLTSNNVSISLSATSSSGWSAVTLATLQVGVFVVGVLGNVSVAASVWRRGTGGQQQPGSHRHSLLLSLALADLLVTLLCLPAAAVRLLAIAWTAPPLLCPLLAAAQNTAHAASTLSLALLALDRYLSVRRPKMAPRVSALTIRLLALLWLLAALAALPRGLASRVRLPGGFCSEAWPAPSARIVYYSAVALVVHVLPCAAVVLCHAAVAASLRRRGLEDTKLNLRPRQVIIMARDRSVGGANNHKIVAAAASSEEDSDAADDERAAKDLREAAAMQATRDAGRGRGPQPPPRAAAAMKPARNVHTIIRAHRRMRIRGPPNPPSIFTSYRGHSVETRRRLARLLVALGAVFAACWLPYVVALVAWACRDAPGTRHALEATLALGHAHSAVNPVVYWLMNRAFLTSLHRLLTTNLRFPSGLACRGGCARPDCLTRPPAPPWAGNSSTNEENLGAFHPKYLNPHALRPQASRCTSHYFH